MRIWKTGFCLGVIALLLVAAKVAGAQTSPNPAGKDKGIVFYEDFEGSSNSRE